MISNLKNQCPICEKYGEPIPRLTVTRMVDHGTKNSVSEGEFYLCMNSRCDVGYFSSKKEIIDKSMFKHPIWFKNGSNPIIACYCGNITDVDVIKTVFETNLKDPQSITLFLRGKLFNTCESTNPMGVCCSDSFQEIIDSALKTKLILLENKNLKLDSMVIDEAKLKTSAPKSTSCGCGCSCKNQESESS